ncbi:hypothetical protein GDO78_019663 [Eleutherodactylus coqui]|uniref:Uncharacterized protein n=1 Tax=Eleutherodactylus coqui TaxID=57060 RepID=A0A8J6B0D6_ELECQ|nr:hypothetical protein GDO78_019663 [Eleutherodactylus coqui]
MLRISHLVRSGAISMVNSQILPKDSSKTPTVVTTQNITKWCSTAIYITRPFLDSISVRSHVVDFGADIHTKRQYILHCRCWCLHQDQVKICTK